MTKLSRKHRLYGFLVCWLLGMLLTALSVLGIPALLLGNPESFALPYSMGAQEREPSHGFNDPVPCVVSSCAALVHNL